MVKVAYVLAPQEAGDEAKKENWRKRVLYVQDVSGDSAHSPKCILAVPVRPPELPLHPEIHAQVLRLLRLRVPPVEILADNVRLLRESYGNRVIQGGKRLFLENQVCMCAELCAKFAVKYGTNTRLLD